MGTSLIEFKTDILDYLEKTRHLDGDLARALQTHFRTGPSKKNTFFDGKVTRLTWREEYLDKGERIIAAEIGLREEETGKTWWLSQTPTGEKFAYSPTSSTTPVEFNWDLDFVEKLENAMSYMIENQTQ
ncbi:hypothetical protein KA001_02515 [Patescibacteria group bacterium]|nr:hypothetical protein [Patescibacteria group bacterium]